MTTKPQPTPATPWDEQIAIEEAALEAGSVRHAAKKRANLYELRSERHGYLKAKAEDADLLALAEQMVAYEDKRTENVSALDVLEAWGTFIDQARAAIARAGGGTPLALVADALDKAEYRLLECSITYQVPGVHSQVGRPARP